MSRKNLRCSGGGGSAVCLMHPFISTRRENKGMWKVLGSREEELCTNLNNAEQAVSSRL